LLLPRPASEEEDGRVSERSERVQACAPKDTHSAPQRTCALLPVTLMCMGVCCSHGTAAAPPGVLPRPVSTTVAPVVAAM
jgi:hypothetical protein